MFSILNRILRKKSPAFWFRATLSIYTPLKYLEMHNSVKHKDKILYPEDPCYGVWIEEIREDYKLPSFSDSIPTPFGMLPRDGGTLLPQLKEFRKIIESPLEKDNLLDEAIKLSDRIMKEFNSPRFFSSNDCCLSFLIFENGMKINHLKGSHYRYLNSIGCNNINDLEKLSDDVFLSLQGIGSKRLQEIRRNISDLIRL